MFLKLEILPFPDDHMVSTHPSFRSLSKYHLNKIHPMTLFKIILAPHFQGISVFSSFSKHLLHSCILSTFSPIPHPMKAGIFVHFVDELVHSQQWCAGACLDHIMGRNWVRFLKSAAVRDFAFIFEGDGNPLQDSFLENSMDRETWWATVHGVAKSQIRLSN